MTRRGGAHYDAVDAGSPGAGEDGGDVCRVALLAVVDALEHAIFTAGSSSSDSTAQDTSRRQESITYVLRARQEIGRMEVWYGGVTGKVDGDVWWPRRSRGRR